MYFKFFPTIEYKIGGEKITITNIFRRFNIRRDFFDDPERFFEYDIQDGETPEIIADKIYDDPELAFVVLLSNNIHNIFEEWPLDSESLERYINNKYGVNGKNNIKHYINSDGQVVSSTNPSYNKYPVTFAEYETELNNDKRKIKLIASNYIERIKRDIRELSKS